MKRFSEHEVVANLPRGLTAATYGVAVTTSGRNRSSSNLFQCHIVVSRGGALVSDGCPQVTAQQ